MNYLALTIGPVDKTLEQAKTTRELWVASFFLSRIAQLMIEAPIKKLLSPQPLAKNQKVYGASVYPDRLYWELDSIKTKEEIIEVENNVLSKLSLELGRLIDVEGLKKYLKLYWLQVSYTEEELKEISFLSRLNETLDGLELQNNWQQVESINLIANLIAKNKNLEKTKRPVYNWRAESAQQLTEKAYGEVGRFPSMVEITTRPLRRFNKKIYDDLVTKKISEKLKLLDENDKSNETNLELKIEEDYINSIKQSELGSAFRSHHKYICIVHSDGDGVGSFLKEHVGNDAEKFINFSILLNNFAIEASQKVFDYGGVPVYSGGDDLLFFAPVKHQEKDEENIMTLIKTLNHDFKEKFLDYSLSQSFGLSITYYKYPMAEAIKSAKDLLIKEAKKKPGKNYVSVRVEKHSGQTFNFGFRQEETGLMYNCFMKLTLASNGKDENFLNSVMYKLNDQIGVIEYINKNPKKLELFFNENFNEAGHLEYKDFFTEVQTLITETFKHFETEKLNQKMERIYSALRFVHFLNAKDTNE